MQMLLDRRLLELWRLVYLVARSSVSETPTPMSLNSSIAKLDFHARRGINEPALRLTQHLASGTGRNAILCTLAGLETGEPLSITLTFSVTQRELGVLSLLFISSLYLLGYVVTMIILSHMINGVKQSSRESHSDTSQSSNSLYNLALPVNNPTYVGVSLEWRKHQQDCL